MNIVGFVKTSLIDYPEKLSAVVFVYGCNFRCGFCHNPDIVLGETKNLKKYSEKEIFSFLNKRKNILEGVVITGGEPTLYPDLSDFIYKIKRQGFSVKLDTNGAEPQVIEELVEENLIDYIAMDIKNSEEKYKETVGNVDFDMDDVKKSIDIIKNSGIDYEFRSTVLPKLHNLEDFHDIGKLIKGARKYCLQEFRRGETVDKSFETERPFFQEEMQKVKKIMQSYVEICEIKNSL